MKSRTLLLWLALFPLLTACGSAGLPGSRAPAPPPGISVDGQGATEAGQDNATRGVGNRDDQPYIGGWSKPGASRAQQLADTETCYNYAWAQVNNDIRIDDDIAAARGELGSASTRLTTVTRQADSYYYRKERIVRLESCMQAKGYSAE
jgi:hypothetical protein